MVVPWISVTGGFVNFADRDAGIERGGDELVAQGVRGWDWLVGSGAACDTT